MYFTRLQNIHKPSFEVSDEFVGSAKDLHHDFKLAYDERGHEARIVGFDFFELMMDGYGKKGVNACNSEITVKGIIPRYPGTHDKSMLFNFTNCSYPMKFLSDNLFDLTSGFSSPKNNPMFKMFRENIQRLHESGITQKLKGIKYSNHESYKKIIRVHEELAKFVPMNLTMLEAGFIIWLVAVAISIVVFFCEIMFYHISCFIVKIRTKSIEKASKQTKIKSRKKKSKSKSIKGTKWWFKVKFG